MKPLKALILLATISAAHPALAREYDHFAKSICMQDDYSGRQLEVFLNKSTSRVAIAGAGTSLTGSYIYRQGQGVIATFPGGTSFVLRDDYDARILWFNGNHTDFTCGSLSTFSQWID